MGLMSIFSADKTKNCDWEQIEKNVASTLFAYYKTDPSRLFAGYPRLVLQKDLTLRVYNDSRNPKYLLGLQDKTLVFLQTDVELWGDWRDSLMSDMLPDPQKLFACMDFSKYLTACLINNVSNGWNMTPLPEIE